MAEPNIAGGGFGTGFMEGLHSTGVRSTGRRAVFSGGLQFDTSGIKTFRSEISKTHKTVQDFWKPWEELDRKIGPAVDKFFDRLDKRMAQSMQNFGKLNNTVVTLGSGGGFHSTSTGGWSSQYKAHTTGATTGDTSAGGPAGPESDPASQTERAAGMFARMREMSSRERGRTIGQAAGRVTTSSALFLATEQDNMIGQDAALNQLQMYAPRYGGRMNNRFSREAINSQLMGTTGWTNRQELYAGGLAIAQSTGVAPGTRGFQRQAAQLGQMSMVLGGDYGGATAALQQLVDPRTQMMLQSAGLGPATPGGRAPDAFGIARRLSGRLGVEDMSSAQVREQFRTGGQLQQSVGAVAGGEGTPLYEMVRNIIMVEAREGGKINWNDPDELVAAGIMSNAQRNQMEFQQAMEKFRAEFAEGGLPVLTTFIDLGRNLFKVLKPLGEPLGFVVTLLGTFGRVLASIASSKVFQYFVSTLTGSSIRGFVGSAIGRVSGFFGRGAANLPSGAANTTGGGGTEVGDGPGRGGDGGSTLAELKEIHQATNPGGRITSTTGGTHTAGSYHYSGNAIDIALAQPSQDRMHGVAAKIARRFGKGLKELIYGGRDGPVQIYNGRKHQYSAATLAAHRDHVHVAATDESLKKIGGITFGSSSTTGTSGGATSRSTTTAVSGVGYSQLAALAGTGAGGGAVSTSGDSYNASDAASAGGGIKGKGWGVIEAAARAAGFSGNRLAVMMAIAQAESGGDPRAHNPVPPDNSYGLWQINMIGNLGPARRRAFGLGSNSDLFDPETNARAAKSILGSQGLDAWSTYTSGAYQQYMPAARRHAETGDNLDLPGAEAPSFRSFSTGGGSAPIIRQGGSRSVTMHVTIQGGSEADARRLVRMVKEAVSDDDDLELVGAH